MTCRDNFVGQRTALEELSKVSSEAKHSCPAGKVNMLEDRVRKLEYELKELKSIVSRFIWKED
jgi:hypothetical protein